MVSKADYIEGLIMKKLSEIKSLLESHKQAIEDKYNNNLNI